MNRIFDRYIKEEGEKLTDGPLPAQNCNVIAVLSAFVTKRLINARFIRS